MVLHYFQTISLVFKTANFIETIILFQFLRQTTEVYTIQLKKKKKYH